MSAPLAKPETRDFLKDVTKDLIAFKPPPGLPSLDEVKNSVKLQNDEQLINILFVRHGLSCSNLAAEIATGSKYLKYHTLYRDPPLASAGITESKEIGRDTKEKLKEKGYAIDIVGSSGLLRAIQTAHYMFDPNEVNVLPFISESYNVPTDTPMPVQQQKKIIEFKIPNYWETNDLEKSDYEKFKKWLGLNLQNMLPTDKATPITIAIVSHGHFMRTHITNTPTDKMSNNDSFMIWFKFNRTNKQLAPISIRNDKFVRVRKTASKIRKQQFCSESCTPINDANLTNPIVKKFLNAMMSCPVYDNKDVRTFDYDSRVGEIKLTFTNKINGKYETKNIQLAERLEDSDKLPEASDIYFDDFDESLDASDIDFGDLSDDLEASEMFGGSKTEQEIKDQILKNLEKEWNDASQWKKRVLIKSAIKALTKSKPFKEVLQEDKNNMEKLYEESPKPSDEILKKNTNNLKIEKSSEEIVQKINAQMKKLNETLLKDPVIQKAVSAEHAPQTFQTPQTLQTQPEINVPTPALQIPHDRQSLDYVVLRGELEKIRADLEAAQNPTKIGEWWEECNALLNIEEPYKMELKKIKDELKIVKAENEELKKKKSISEAKITVVGGSNDDDVFELSGDEFSED